jgi:NitT/TauT family transport system substrate-binding protein
MTGRNAWIDSHTVTINKLMDSLVQAENYVISHPTESKVILWKRLNYTEEYMAQIWPQNHYSLTLDQSLVTAMEDEGRWMIMNNLTNEKAIPDYQNYFYTKGLEKVKPESVNIL